MTTHELDQMYSELDQCIEKSVAASDAKPPCKRGCFFCCKEPVYVTSIEVKGILDMLTPEQKDRLSARVSLWRDRFLESGSHSEDEPKVIGYRTLNLWCPLLSSDGSCSVYERRPCGCRLHIAKQSSEGCEKDELREHQIFVYFEGLGEKINLRWQQMMKDGDRIVYDHLGILLYEALFNVETATNSRVEVSIEGENMTILTREPDTRT
jgi:Fe-S-cluster containining protein